MVYTQIRTLQDSSIIALDNINNTTQELRTVLTTSSSGGVQIFESMVEAAVRRALEQHTSTAHIDLPPAPRVKDQAPAVNDPPRDSSLIKTRQEVFAGVSMGFRNPKKQNSTMKTYRYKFITVTILQDHTKRSETGPVTIGDPHAVRTTVLVDLNTRFLDRAISLQYGLSTPGFHGRISNVNFRSYYTVNLDSPIVRAITTVDYSRFLQLLDERTATPFDVVIQDSKNSHRFRKTLFDIVMLYLGRHNQTSRGTTLLQMGQLLIDSGVDCGENKPIGPFFGSTQLEADAMRMILRHSQSDPFGTSTRWDVAIREVQELIVGQEEWDTMDQQTEFERNFGAGSWRRVLVEGADLALWAEEQSAAWKQEPRYVRYAQKASRKRYGLEFVTHRWLPLLQQDLRKVKSSPDSILYGDRRVPALSS